MRRPRVESIYRAWVSTVVILRRVKVHFLQLIFTAHLCYRVTTETKSLVKKNGAVIRISPYSCIMMQVDHMTLDTWPSSLLSYSRIKPHFHSYWAKGLGTRLRKVGYIHGGRVGQCTTLTIGKNINWKALPKLRTYITTQYRMLEN